VWTGMTCACARGPVKWRVLYLTANPAKPLEYHVCTRCLKMRQVDAAQYPALMPDKIEEYHDR
jgi:hypothetical protein